MWPLGTIDALILAPVALLAIAAITLPANRGLRIASVVSLAAVALGYTLLRPSARAALAYHENTGGTWSKDWLAGVESVLAVTQHLPTVVLLAALLLAVIALRSK
jgi:hypothetical protein